MMLQGTLVQLGGIEREGFVQEDCVTIERPPGLRAPDAPKQYIMVSGLSVPEIRALGAFFLCTVTLEITKL